MLNWDEFNEVENTEKTKQVPQEVVKKAVKQTAQETEEQVSRETVSSVQAGDRAQLAKEAIEILMRLKAKKSLKVNQVVFRLMIKQ